VSTEQRSPTWISSHARKAAKSVRRLFEEARPVRPNAALFSQGQSFLVTANLIVSFLAAHPEGRVFIIDKKTSYGVLAKLAAEEASSSVLRPPKNFPNIFQGGYDP
jgi:hypothetical protein